LNDDDLDEFDFYFSDESGFLSVGILSATAKDVPILPNLDPSLELSFANHVKGK
jgi:hypothetical protein